MNHSLTRQVTLEGRVCFTKLGQGIRMDEKTEQRNDASQTIPLNSTSQMDGFLRDVSEECGTPLSSEYISEDRRSRNVTTLLEILNPDHLRCAQFLRGGRVRLSFREKSVRDHLLTEGLRFGDEDIPVTRHAEKLIVVYVRDLPYDVSSDDVLGFFGTFGEVLTVERSVSPDFPSLCTRNPIIKIVLQESLPYF